MTHKGDSASEQGGGVARRLVYDADSLWLKWRRECEHCHGSGEVFTHADDCRDDLCALNGDIYSCCGQVVPCDCWAAAEPRKDATVK